MGPCSIFAARVSESEFKFCESIIRPPERVSFNFSDAYGLGTVLIAAAHSRSSAPLDGRVTRREVAYTAGHPGRFRCMRGAQLLAVRMSVAGVLTTVAESRTEGGGCYIMRYG